LLEKPDLPDETLLTCLQQAFNSGISRVEFLPLGADRNTAVYHAWDRQKTSYFVRLRSGGFDPTGVTLLHFLHQHGVHPIIAPLPARDGRLWAALDEYKVMLYPYIESQNMYETGLSNRQWSAFGQALKRLHRLSPPVELAMRIYREQFAPFYRQSLRACLEQAVAEMPEEPIAQQCTTLLRQHSAEIRTLIARTERLAAILPGQELPLVLCHADLHAGNLLVEPNGRLHIIDWDEIVLAPKEHDLMYIGGGLLGNWRSPAEEEDLFYQGYGQVAVDPVALAYYRYERIITDLAIYGKELLSDQGSREDREQSFHYMRSNFDLGGVLEIARQSDQA
jgi:spectinomycin phosphotransferase